LKGAAFLRDLRSIMGEASTSNRRASQSTGSEASHRRATA